MTAVSCTGEFRSHVSELRASVYVCCVVVAVVVVVVVAAGVMVVPGVSFGWRCDMSCSALNVCYILYMVYWWPCAGACIGPASCGSALAGRDHACASGVWIRSPRGALVSVRKPTPTHLYNDVWCQNMYERNQSKRDKFENI